MSCFLELYFLFLSHLWLSFKRMLVETFKLACSRRSYSRARVYNLTRSLLTAPLYYLNAWNRLPSNLTTSAVDYIGCDFGLHFLARLTKAKFTCNRTEVC